jgi:hypothetical protein
MAFDANNNAYSIGWFNGTVDVDNGPNTYNLTAVGIGNMFLLKEDAAGNFIWAKHFVGMSSGSNGLWGRAIDIDASGNIYIAGAIRDSFDMDPGPGVYKLSTGGAQVTFLLKLDSAGNFVWAKKHEVSVPVNNTSGPAGMKIVGNVIYLAGGFAGTVDIDPGAGVFNVTSTPGVGGDMLLIKMDTTGNFIWGKTMGGTGIDGIYSIRTDSVQNLYIAGGFSNTVDFDPSPSVTNLTSNGGSKILGPHDPYVAKYDSAGNYIWAKGFGGGSDEWAWGLSLDPWGNVIVTGFFNGTVDFDPGPGVYNITASSRDMFTLRLRNNGDFSWAISVHPGGNDEGRAIATDGQGNVYTTGYFLGSADFDPGPAVYSLGGGVYVQKLDSAGNFVWARAWASDIPGWIGLDHANNIYVTGTYSTLVGGTADFDPGPGTFLLSGSTSGAGFIEKLCQSATGVNLVADTTTICAGDTAHLSTAFIPNATYYWSKNGAVITGATANTLNVITAGAYVVDVYGNGCPTGSNAITVTVTPVLHPTISLTGPSSANIGQQVTVNATVTNAGASYNINWKNNNIIFATTSVPSVTYTKQAGPDNITATVIPVAPCADSTTSSNKIISGIDGISEIMQAADIAVYPNPFGSLITVKGLKQKDRLTLVDITGRTIYTWQATKETQTFKAEGLAAGHYILKIMNEKGAVRVNVPVVKQ